MVYTLVSWMVEHIKIEENLEKFAEKWIAKHLLYSSQHIKELEFFSFCTGSQTYLIMDTGVYVSMNSSQLNVI